MEAFFETSAVGVQDLQFRVPRRPASEGGSEPEERGRCSPLVPV